MVEAVVLKYLENNPDTTIEKLKEVFPDKLQGSLGIIRSASDKINDKNRYFPAKTPKGESFYICNQWGTQTINFIDYVNNSKDINIQIENVNNRNKE